MKVGLIDIGIYAAAVLAVATIVHFAKASSYHDGFSAGYEAHKASMTMIEHKDLVCSSWMLQTNMKEAKARICNKGRT